MSTQTVIYRFFNKKAEIRRNMSRKVLFWQRWAIENSEKFEMKKVGNSKLKTKFEFPAFFNCQAFPENNITRQVSLNFGCFFCLKIW